MSCKSLKTQVLPVPYESLVKEFEDPNEPFARSPIFMSSYVQCVPFSRYAKG